MRPSIASSSSDQALALLKDNFNIDLADVNPSRPHSAALPERMPHARVHARHTVVLEVVLVVSRFQMFESMLSDADATADADASAQPSGTRMCTRTHAHTHVSTHAWCAYPRAHACARTLDCVRKSAWLWLVHIGYSRNILFIIVTNMLARRRPQERWAASAGGLSSWCCGMCRRQTSSPSPRCASSVTILSLCHYKL